MSEIIVTGMPSIPIYGSTRKEYFHPDSGMVNGDFYSDNDGQYISNKVLSFYKQVFKTPYDSPAILHKKYLYSLYGSKTIAPGTRFDKTYHLGVDMTSATGARVYAAHAGTITRSVDGVFGIYDGNMTYFYLHMAKNSNLLEGESVAVGDFIGTQSNKGTKDSHLHFQVNSGELSQVPYPSTSLTSNLNAVIPYRYM